MGNIIILDTEFDGRTVRRRFCDPLEKDHKLIMIQIKPIGGKARYLYSKEGLDRNIKLPLNNIDLIVGHNLKIDLLYLWENETLRDFIRRGGQIWDTCLAEYLINGQNKNLSYSLEEVCKRYKVAIKSDIGKYYFEQGKLFSEIPKDLAIKYGLQDVTSSEEVYLKQMERVDSLDMRNILQIHMNHLLAVTEIEFNGLKINTNILHEELQKQHAAVDRSKLELEEYILTNTDWPKDVSLNINSTPHLSAILFGGEIKYEALIPNPSKSGEAYYKTGAKKGELRQKKGVLTKIIKGFDLSEYKIKSEATDLYQTGSGILKDVQHPIAKKLLAFRKEYKILNTYLKAFQEIINPYTGGVHSEFQTISTATGRLSSRNPNLQNVSPNVLRCFDSRFKEGKIVELDFNQLEVCVAADLFKDNLLKMEILNNVDIHYNNAVKLFQSTDITKAQRKIAKFLTFGLLYGQGSTSMSKSHGISKERAKRFIEIFYNKYCNIREEHDKLVSKVKALEVSPGQSYYTTPTKRRYYFQEQEDLYKGGYSYAPTNLKNYPIQGTASDVTACAVGRVFRFIVKNNLNVKLINEVHDSLVLDVPNTCSQKVINKIKAIMEDSSKYLQKKVNHNIDIPLSVDVSYGNTWEECKR